MTSPATRLTRDTRHAVLGGVCAGLARRFGISTTALRVAFVVSCVLPGPQFLAYALLWLVLPADPR